MLLSLGFPYRLSFCFPIPLPVPSPLFFHCESSVFLPLSLSLSLFLLIVTFTPVDYCARYYTCIIGFAGSSNGSQPTRFQRAPCAPRFSRFLPSNRSQLSAECSSSEQHLHLSTIPRDCERSLETIFISLVSQFFRRTSSLLRLVTRLKTKDISNKSTGQFQIQTGRWIKSPGR